MLTASYSNHNFVLPRFRDTTTCFAYMTACIGFYTLLQIEIGNLRQLKL